MSYLYNTNDNSLLTLKKYDFVKETKLQELLAAKPEVILNIPELEIGRYDEVIVCREFQTSSGKIDVLIITDSGEIIIIETKLLKNPESTRVVIAQVIDYIKALTLEDIDETITKISRISKKDSIPDKLRTHISNNISYGNFKVIIVGDFISPNVLGMVDAIQSAPHLSFSIYLVELNVFEHENSIVITPKLVANTYEIERSVIRLELPTDRKYIVKSEIPSKESKGNRPILEWGQYIETINDVQFRDLINKFRNDWITKFGKNNIHMGFVGFSAGVASGGSRIPIISIYNDYLALLSEQIKNNYDITDELYETYKNDFKRIPNIYDEYIIGKKVKLSFEKISPADFEIILKASMSLAIKLKDIDLKQIEP